jgi:hypothetical protein
METTISITQKPDLDDEPLSPLPVQFITTATHTTWDRMLFFTQFIRDLAIRENLEISQCLKFYENLSTEGLFALTGLLTSVNQEYARNGDDFECIMCYEIPHNMRQTRCCHQTICEACAEEFINDPDARRHGNCMYCRTSVPLVNIDTYTEPSGQEGVEEARSKEKSFVKHASDLIEVFITEYLLRKPTPDTVRTILQYITSDPALPKEKLSFIVSESMICSVVRKLIMNNNLDEIEVQCKRIVNKEKTLDFPLAVCVAQVREDQLLTVSVQSLLAQAQKYLAPSPVIVQQLTTIAYKKILIKHTIDLITSNTPLDVRLMDILDNIFEDSSAIMFLLRQLTRVKGLSYTKQTMVRFIILFLTCCRDINWHLSSPSHNGVSVQMLQCL